MYSLLIKGYQVAPTELEKIILNHDDVLDAAVGSIPDESAGELPRAYVVKRPGSALKEADIIEYIEGKKTIIPVYIWKNNLYLHYHRTSERLQKTQRRSCLYQSST